MQTQAKSRQVSFWYWVGSDDDPSSYSTALLSWLIPLLCSQDLVEVFKVREAGKPIGRQVNDPKAEAIPKFLNDRQLRDYQVTSKPLHNRSPLNDTIQWCFDPHESSYLDLNPCLLLKTFCKISCFRRLSDSKVLHYPVIHWCYAVRTSFLQIESVKWMVRNMKNMHNCVLGDEVGVLLFNGWSENILIS